MEDRYIDFLDELRKLYDERIVGESFDGDDLIKENEILSKHTTIKIGGPARVFVVTPTYDAVVLTYKLCKKYSLRYMVLGNASNMLFDDKEFDGVIISTDCRDSEISSINIFDKDSDDFSEFFGKFGYKDLDDLEADAFYVTAGGGARLSAFANKVGKKSLAGAEFSGGIPGSIGGAVTMNAGAYGSEIKDIIVSVRALNEDGEVVILSKDELQLAYRKSVIQEKGYIVLEALFALKKGNQEEIFAKMRELNDKRRDKQPLEYPSCGSTFKRPVGGFAAQMIDESGLKGYRVGDMMISEKHAGFMVNVGNGNFHDAMEVIKHVQEKVNEKFDVELEPEVRIISE